jgi:hypothetical protein
MVLVNEKESWLNEKWLSFLFIYDSKFKEKKKAHAIITNHGIAYMFRGLFDSAVLIF